MSMYAKVRMTRKLNERIHAHLTYDAENREPRSTRSMSGLWPTMTFTGPMLTLRNQNLPMTRSLPFWVSLTIVCPGLLEADSPCEVAHRLDSTCEVPA